MVIASFFKEFMSFTSNFWNQLSSSNCGCIFSSSSLPQSHCQRDNASEKLPPLLSHTTNPKVETYTMADISPSLLILTHSPAASPQEYTHRYKTLPLLQKPIRSLRIDYNALHIENNAIWSLEWHDDLRNSVSFKKVLSICSALSCLWKKYLKHIFQRIARPDVRPRTSLEKNVAGAVK